MAASDFAPPTRLVVILASGEHHRVINEIRTEPNGEHRISISRWRDWRAVRVSKDGRRNSLLPGHRGSRRSLRP
jgi:hypothetical protein